MKSILQVSSDSGANWIHSVSTSRAEEDIVVFVSPEVKMSREEGRSHSQLYKFIELVFPHSLSVDHNHTGSTGDVSVVPSPFNSSEEEVSCSIPIAVSKHINIGVREVLEEGSQQNRRWEVIFSTMLSAARAGGIIGVVSEIIRVHTLRHPVGLGGISSVALDRAVNDELDTSCLVPCGIVGIHNISEASQVGTRNPIVPVDINGETISQAMVDCWA